MNPVLRTTALCAAIHLCLSTAALAQDPTTLDTLQVTASRVEKPVAEALASVTVLTRADIEASQAPDLIDLLGRQTGVDIARTGGPGGASTVFLRGGNAPHTLVLVDGIRVSSTGQGVFDFAHLPLEQIERIEIVRGPRAALWGSDAIAGVIHVFTRDPSAPSARLHAGSYGRAGASASTGVGDASHGFGVTAGYQRLHGFSATNPLATFSYDPDDDGYRNRNLGLRGRTTIGSQRLAFSAVATDADVEFDQGTTHARNSSAGATLGGDLGERWSHQLTLGHAREDLDTTSSYSNAFRSRRTSLDWVNSLRLGAHGTLNLGVNWQEEQGISSNAFDGQTFDRTRRSHAAFAGYGLRLGANLFDASLRHDDSNQFGAARTASAAWGRDLGERARARLSWGEGFRAPNFNELYYPDTGYGFAGNPDLKPERSETWEAGLELSPASGHQLGLSAFRSRVKDLVAFAAPGTNNAININRARIAGVELEYRYLGAAWTFGGNVARLDTEDAATGQPLLRRARDKAHADVGYRFANGLELGLDGDYASTRRDVGGNPGAYAIAHLRLAWPLSPAWRLEARVENLGDRDYALVQGFNTPGRSGVVSVVWNGKH
jgi:vitamin B12 transporter